MDCKHCGSERGQYVRNIARSGVSQIWLMCEKCGKNARGVDTFWVKKTVVENMGIDINALPIKKDNRGKSKYPGRRCVSNSAIRCSNSNSMHENITCAVSNCFDTGVEYNHIMPAHLQGIIIANRWPVIPLCRKHHHEWHQFLTPNMNGTGKVLVINFCPLCFKRVDRSAWLNHSTAPARWNIHCQQKQWVHFTSDKDGKDYVVFLAKANHK